MIPERTLPLRGYLLTLPALPLWRECAHGACEARRRRPRRSRLVPCRGRLVQRLTLPDIPQPELSQRRGQRPPGHQWSPVVSGGQRWSPVVTSGHQWSPVVTSGQRWSAVVTSGHQWSFIVSGGRWSERVSSGQG